MKLLALVFLASCASVDGAAPVSETPAEVSHGPAIARVLTRDGALTIYGQGGSLGIELDGARVSLDELKTAHPDLYEVVTTGSASAKTFLDARVDLPESAEK